MGVPATLADLDPIAANNSPSGSDPIGTNLDDYLRSHAAFIKQISVGTGVSGVWGIGITGNAATATLATSATSATSAASLTQAYGASGNILTSTGSAWVSAPPIPGVPSGAVFYFAMSTAPSGYLKCDGALVSRSTYAALFSAIGTTFGAGDGSTTFALPDLRGEFLRSLDDGRGVDSGRTLGSAQSGAIQSHTHTIHSLTGSNWSGTNGYSVGYGQGDSGWVTDKIGSTGGTETRPRNVALLACIKI